MRELLTYLCHEYRNKCLAPLIPPLHHGTRGSTTTDSRPATDHAEEVLRIVTRWQRIYSKLMPIELVQKSNASSRKRKHPEIGAELECQSENSQPATEVQQTLEVREGSLMDIKEVVDVVVYQILLALRSTSQLGVTWFAARHVLSLAVILRVTERFMEHLRSAYVPDNEAESLGYRTPTRRVPAVGRRTPTPPSSAMSTVGVKKRTGLEERAGAAYASGEEDESDTPVATYGGGPESGQLPPSPIGQGVVALMRLSAVGARPRGVSSVDQVFELDIVGFFRQRRLLVNALRQRSYPPFTIVRVCELLSPAEDVWSNSFWDWCVAMRKTIADAASSYGEDHEGEVDLVSAESKQRIEDSYLVDTPGVMECYFAV